MVCGGLQVYGQVSGAVQERQRLVRQLLQAVTRCLAVRTLPTLPPTDVRLDAWKGLAAATLVCAPKGAECGGWCVVLCRW